VNFNANDHRWCALQVKAQHERSVASSLRSRGHDQFLPLKRLKRKWSDRTKEIEFPLFAGYVFCRLNLQIPSLIMSTPGVIRIVGTRREIAVIDDREIEAIRVAAASGRDVEPCAYVDIGTRVLISKGVLAGVEGTLVGRGNAQRLVLSVDMIQRSISVEMDDADIQCLLASPKVLPNSI
jgi:transcription antitermination factor NusG